MWVHIDVIKKCGTNVNKLSKDRENLKYSLHTRGKKDSQSSLHVTFNPSGGTALQADVIL